MPAERIIAVDFGTSTSVIRVKRYLNGQPVGDRLVTAPVTFNMGATMVPTLVQKMKSTGESVYFGHEAEIPHKNTETFRNFKVDIENPDPALREQARALTAEFFGFLAKTYRTQSEGGHLGENDDRVRTIVSYPVKWSEDTKAFMLETARNAGFPNVEGQDEAQAAIQAVTIQSEKHLLDKGYFTSGTPVNILLIDMGAGTTDLVFCRHTPGESAKTEILTTWPREGGTLFGGQEVDELLKDFICAAVPVNGIAIVRQRIGTDKFKAWKENVVSPALARGESVDYFSTLDDLLDLLNINVQYLVDRPSLESFMSDYLRQLPELVNGCLREAGVRGDDVDLVILTGGHSQWYFGRDILSGTLERFGDVGLKKIQADPGRIISIALPQETVALGLAYSSLKISPKPALKPTPKPKSQTQTSQPVRLERPVRPARPTRPSLPGKNAGIEEIKTFYHNNRWKASSISLNLAIYLRPDGTVVADGSNINDKDNIQNWRDIVSIDCNGPHAVGLRSDGTVMAVGRNDDGQCNVQNWRDIVAIACGDRYTVGLRSNGTVVAVGRNNLDQCDVQNWRDIVSIACGNDHTVGLRSDGTVVAVGSYFEGQCNVRNWRDIVSIVCGAYHTVGLRSDGTVVAVGRNGDGECNVQNWRDIVSIVCGAWHTVGLRSDGTVVAVGVNSDGRCNVQEWRDIVSIACETWRTVGLRSDGTVVALGDNRRGQCNVQNWKNVLSIDTDSDSTIAVLNDGSVISTDYTWEQRPRLFGLLKEDFTRPLPTKTLPFKLF